MTQDFLMACGTYPEDEEWFIEELRQEAEYAALTLRNKPSLVWWSGDNENAVHGNDEMEDYTGRKSAYRGIASVLYKLDPARAFLPSSPYGGNKYASNTVGTTHNTCYLGSFIFPYMMKGECADYREHFKQYRARFIAEEPQLGAISESSIRRFMTEEDVFGASDEMWNYHTKSNPAIKTTLFDMSLSFTRALLGEFTSASDRFFKLRYLQYEWVRLLMEQARREMWFSSGIIFWMLNDCWPASSGWSLMDFYGKPKDALYAFRRCSEKVLLSIDKESGGFSVVASNIGDTVENARVTLTRVKCNKEEKLAEFVGSIAAENSTALIELGIELADDEVLVAELSADGIADRTFYRNGALTLVPTEAVTMTHDAAARTVTVSADSYVHAVELDADAIFSDNCFNLLPGESRTVSYEPMGDVGEVNLTAYTV
jgi:beta-mannosidase